VSPLSPSYQAPQVTAHDRLGHELLALIPPGAPISAQSNLYPHLAHRVKAYLYPAVNDADYVFLDVTGSPHPLTPFDHFCAVQRLLREGDFGVLAAEDGYLLLQRGLRPPVDAQLPDSFYSFARLEQPAGVVPLAARFDAGLELLAYEHQKVTVVSQVGLPAQIATYWRAVVPVSRDMDIALFFTRQDGAIAFAYDEPTASSLWYPTSRWQVGEVVRWETPILQVERGADVLLALVRPGGDAWAPGDRLAAAPQGPESEVLGDGTLVRLFRFL